MEENAQLRADKMLMSTSTTTTMTTNALTTATAICEEDQVAVEIMASSSFSTSNKNNYYNNQKHVDELNLYSTVKNKKMDQLLREQFYLSNNTSQKPTVNQTTQNFEFFDQNQSFNNHEHDYDSDMNDINDKNLLERYYFT